MTDETTTLPPMVKLEDVEWRLDSEAYSRGGGREYVARWVPYLDASKVARLLDEWVGPARWRIDGYFVPDWTENGLMCQISLKFGDEWVPRMDIGEKMRGIHEAKGSVSDAFKRTACRAWGAGRNVYEMPTLYAPCRVKFGNDGNPERDGKGKIRAFGSTNDTERELINQLRQAGFDDPSARISMVTEGADQFGEGPAGVVIPDDTAGPETAPEPQETAVEPTQAHAATVTPIRTVNTPEAVREAVSGPTPGGVSLPELLSTFTAVPRPMMDELRGAGLWPVGKVETAEGKERAVEIITRYQESAG